MQSLQTIHTLKYNHLKHGSPSHRRLACWAPYNPVTWWPLRAQALGVSGVLWGSQLMYLAESVAAQPDFVRDHPSYWPHTPMRSKCALCGCKRTTSLVASYRWCALCFRRSIGISAHLSSRACRHLPRFFNSDHPSYRPRASMRSKYSLCGCRWKTSLGAPCWWCTL